MTELMFGAGKGEITDVNAAKIETIAKVHGCNFVTSHDAGCLCGDQRHARRNNCPDLATYWFAGPNRGELDDDALIAEVLADVERAGIALPP